MPTKQMPVARMKETAAQSKAMHPKNTTLQVCKQATSSIESNSVLLFLRGSLAGSLGGGDGGVGHGNMGVLIPFTLCTSIYTQVCVYISLIKIQTCAIS